MPRSTVPADFYHADTYAAEASVGFMMRRVLLSMVQETGRRLEPHGITHAQWQPLLKLLLGKASTVAELARELEMDPGATTRLLDRLEAKGLCRRIRSATDRRVVNVELTPEGEQVAQHIPRALSEVMNYHLAGFSKSEWLALKGYLHRMLDNGEAFRQEP
ncbi:MarR family winged helix-turn-helix transcriptional regulator [Rhizobacter sp. Root1221]|uniref:MarR family winged helix-turn-helix transcriptional regulator n=1 Tax=Rhizobacter sp. Root1221 TaxID=1736433 RepID=UPI0007014F44|nr:MarR family transcriptional regulator [Rhizobacter sp. Root1221]KQW02314.1 MarR family transcriptional regulator [Rhizobacter sp. Root1221]